MASNINIILSGAILQVIQNTDSSQRVQSPLSVTLPGSEATYIEYLPISGGAGTALSLPAATIWCLVVFNLGGTNGTPAGNLTCRIQNTGGALIAAADSEVVAPLGAKIFWQPTESANGIIGVTLIASIANTPARILMGA